MDHNYPSIYLYGENGDRHSDDVSKVLLSYGKERRDRIVDDSDWICPNVHPTPSVMNFAYRNSAISTTIRPDRSAFDARLREEVCLDDCVPNLADFKSDAMPAAKVTNTGDNDASPENTPSQFLLVRGLEGSVTEELFAKGVMKLNKPSGSASQPTTAATKKGAKVASTTGDANLGAREGTLRRVLLIRDRRSNESWKYGFAEYASIEDAQAALVRFNSFDRFTIASKNVMINYIHAGVFVPALNPSPSTERFLFSPLNNSALKLSYWDEDAYVTELVVNAAEPADRNSKESSAAKLAESEGLKSAGKDKEKKRKAAAEANSATAKKPAASHLQFWSNRHAELHGIKAGSGNGSSVANSENGEASSPPAVAPTQSFVDPERYCCYLCMRQFNNITEANTHERVSELHRTYLKQKTKILKALGKLEKHSIAIIPVAAGTDNDYRDRAKERRQVYGVVNKKGEIISSGKKKRNPVASASDSEPEATTPVKSKGAALLSKMGYTPGAGLGAKGNEGIAAPISQNVYAAGVGLGAEGGKRGDAVEEAQRNTKGGGFGDWVAQGKDRARERYEKMG